MAQSSSAVSLQIWYMSAVVVLFPLLPVMATMVLSPLVSISKFNFTNDRNAFCSNGFHHFVFLSEYPDSLPLHPLLKFVQHYAHPLQIQFHLHLAQLYKYLFSLPPSDKNTGWPLCFASTAAPTPLSPPPNNMMILLLTFLSNF